MAGAGAGQELLGRVCLLIGFFGERTLRGRQGGLYNRKLLLAAGASVEEEEEEEEGNRLPAIVRLTALLESWMRVSFVFGCWKTNPSSMPCRALLSVFFTLREGE